MSIYETPEQLPILAAMQPGAVIWDAETTATAADPYPGPATPARGTELVWSTSGDVEDVGDVVELRVERNGYPGGALAVQQRLTSAASWCGWDAPTTIGYVEPIDWTASAVDNAYPSICALPDGRVVVVAEDTSDHTLRVIVREPDGTIEGPQEAITVPSTQDVSPAIVATGDGFVRIYVWVAYDRAELAQIWVYEAPDDASSADLADGTAWSLVVTDALDVPVSGATAWPIRSSAAIGGGQVVLVYIHDGDIRQVYSADGYRFQATATEIAGVGPRVAYESGRFVLVYGDTGTDIYYSRAIANAATPFDSVSTVTALDTSGGVVGGHRGSLVGDGAGHLWLYVETDGGGWALGASSSDGGDTWALSALWGSFDGASGQMQTAACWWRDRVLMVARAHAAAGYEDSLLLLHLGGWSTLVHPRRLTGPLEIGERAAWNQAWAPVETPGSAYTQTGATTTAAFTANAAYRVTTSGIQNIAWAADGAPAALFPWAMAAAVDVAAGLAEVQVSYAVSIGVEAYAAVVRVSTTGLTYYDGHGAGPGTPIATATISGPVEVALWVDGRASAAYYRAWAAGTPSEWTLLGSTTTLTSGTASSGGATLAVGSSADVEVFKIASFGANSHLDPVFAISDGPVLVTGTAAPGLPVSGARQYLANGVFGRAARGPGRLGDEWTIAAASPFGVEYAAWTSANNSPARGWVSTGVATEAIAWRFADAPIKMPPLWAIHWRGDVQAIWYSWHDGTSWGSETSAVAYLARTCTRYGSTLYLSGGTQGPFVQADELVGGFAVDADGKARRITSNTPGVIWQGSSTVAATVITIDSDNTERTSSSTWRIVWPQGVTIVNPPNTAKGLRIRVAVSGGVDQTPTGKHSLKVLAGPCVVLGLPHGNDTQIEHEARPRSFETPNGRRRITQAAPARRVVTMTWQSTVDRLWQVQGNGGNSPDVIAWDTQPLYSRGEAASTLRACVERWAADGTPVLYLPRVDIEGATMPQTWVDHRAGGVVVGTIDPMWTVETAGRGLEQNTEIARLGAIRLTELT